MDNKKSVWDKNRAHSSIEALLEPLKKDVEDQLISGKKYQDISDYLSHFFQGSSKAQCR